jgi:hypothetical protein
VRWVTTDLNSPWYPEEKPDRKEIKQLAKSFPEQHRQVDDDLARRLKVAWENLCAISAEVDKRYPIRRRS